MSCQISLLRIHVHGVGDVRELIMLYALEAYCLFMSDRDEVCQKKYSKLRIVELFQTLSGIDVVDFQESSGNLLTYFSFLLNFQLILLSLPFQAIGSNSGFPCFRGFTIP